MNEELFTRNGRPLLEQRLYILEGKVKEWEYNPDLSSDINKVLAQIEAIDAKWCPLCGQRREP